MPLVWYSMDANEVYHVCLDCEVHEQILRRNLAFVSEADVEAHTNLAMCQMCQSHTEPGVGHDGPCRQMIFSYQVYNALLG